MGTRVSWTVRLHASIDPVKSSYKISPERINIKLVKSTRAMWRDLEYNSVPVTKPHEETSGINTSSDKQPFITDHSQSDGGSDAMPLISKEQVTKANQPIADEAKAVNYTASSPSLPLQPTLSQPQTTVRMALLSSLAHSLGGWLCRAGEHGQHVLYECSRAVPCKHQKHPRVYVQQQCHKAY